jgi:hypothetical protein
MQNPFRKFMGGEGQEPLSKPVSISYGKAVQLKAEGLARNDKIGQPKKKHYKEADKYAEDLDEFGIEAHALMQKLKELVGLENTSMFLHVIEDTKQEVDTYVKQTAEAELEDRLVGILESYQREHSAPDRESLVKAIQDSAELYQMEVAAQVDDVFNELKANIQYDERMQERVKVEETVNEIIQHFSKGVVEAAVTTYKRNMTNLIVEKLKEMGIKFI